MSLTVYIPGVWDLLHVGHVKILERAALLGNRLIVGVPSDEVVLEDKGVLPVIPLNDRLCMLRALRCVYLAAPYYQLEFLTHLNQFSPSVLAVGSTWGSAPRHRAAEEWVRKNGKVFSVLPYTEGVSTTWIKNKIVEQCRFVEYKMSNPLGLEQQS